MDNNKPSQAPQGSGTWMNESDYKNYKDLQAARLSDSRRRGTMTRLFFIFSAVGGLFVAAAFIGTLIAPTEIINGRGQDCTSSTFGGTKLLLNFLGYTLLFVTGILGVTISNAKTRVIGILLIILAPIVGVGIALTDFWNALCGV